MERRGFYKQDIEIGIVPASAFSLYLDHSINSIFYERIYFLNVGKMLSEKSTGRGIEYYEKYICLFIIVDYFI
ncbi:hypothetical protein H7T43_16740 [Peribacillus simplex]|nr:hypothetical protein [Peribacillus simplex]